LKNGRVVLFYLEGQAGSLPCHTIVRMTGTINDDTGHIVKVA